MSSNLDHVLYNKQNNDIDEKVNDASAFSRKYGDDIPGFLSFFSDPTFAVLSSYSESWEYIQEGVNSLGRYSNFGLFLLEKCSDNT